MSNIPFFTNVSVRQVAGNTPVLVKNRFAEPNPVLNDGQMSLVARPALKKFTEVGTGHIRKVFSQPGVFDNDLFVISGTDLYRVDPGANKTNLGTISANPTTSVSMCATAPIGTAVPAYLFISEGGQLSVWTDNGQALGHLHATGTIANNDVVRIDGVYYKFTTGDVNAGTPAGTSGSPYLVAKGVGNAEALTNLYDAIGDTGLTGTAYSSLISVHPTVQAYNVSTNDLYVCALDCGTAGNSIVTTVTSSFLTWSTGGTLTGGGANMLRQILVPDDVGAISVAVINGYVIVVPKQLPSTMGKFFFILPGETKIDPLNYAFAERSPDGIHQVVVFGEQFWLLGEDTSEPWITTGDPAAPVAKFQGQLYDRGAWNGSAIQVKDSLILVDQNGGVFQLAGGANRISSPDIEELIRRAIQKSALLSTL